MISEILFYLGSVFLLSWSCWLGLLWGGSGSQIQFWVAGFAPTLSALLLLLFREGWGGLKRTLKPRVSLKPVWYSFCLLASPLIMGVSLLIHIFLGGEIPRLLDPMHLVTSLDQWPGIIIVFVYILVFSALGEEIGWRGYLLPRLLKRRTPIQASMILGSLWACWHLPLFWLPDTIQAQLPLSWFLAQILGSTFLYTWLHLRTDGRLLPAILFHASGNASLGLLPVLPADNGGSLQPLWLIVGLLWFIVILVIYLDRDLFFLRVQKKPAQS